MRLWRHIRRVLWAVGITTVLILATVECLYRASLTHLPLLPPHMNGASVPVLMARATWAAEERSMLLQVRRLVPWTLLRVLTRILRARKGHSGSSPGFRLANQSALEWALKVEGQKRSLHKAVERLGLSIWITRNWSAEKLNPWCHPERALRRRNAVLRTMRQNGFIHATEEATALAAPLRLAPRPARWRACPA